MSGPDGSSTKEALLCAAGAPGLSRMNGARPGGEDRRQVHGVHICFFYGHDRFVPFNGMAFSFAVTFEFREGGRSFHPDKFMG